MNVFSATLCENCAHKRTISTAKGSKFLLCRLAGESRQYAKYPPQPVLHCQGFRLKNEEQGTVEDSDRGLARQNGNRLEEDRPEEDPPESIT